MIPVKTMREILKIMLIIVYSVICAYEDFRKRSIGIKLSAAAALAGALLTMIEAWHTGTAIMLVDALKAFTPGVIVVVLSLLTGGAIGIGDGIFLIISGIYMGMRKTFTVMKAAWCICAAWGLFIIVNEMLHGRSNERCRNKGVPFVTAALPIVIGISVLRLKEIIYGM